MNNISIKDGFTGEVFNFSDSSFPLSSESFESLTVLAQVTEDTISELEWRGGYFHPLPESHELIQLEKELTQLFQSNAEWHKAHPTHW